MLTFDDGPLPPYSNRILDVLAENCVKATYFLVGRMSRGYPALARRIRAEGHTIGTHSENHLLAFDQAPIDTVKYEIEQGIISVGAALGDPRAVTPFFRIPGFLRRSEVEAYLQSPASRDLERRCGRRRLAAHQRLRGGAARHHAAGTARQGRVAAT